VSGFGREWHIWKTLDDMGVEEFDEAGGHPRRDALVFEVQVWEALCVCSWHSSVCFLKDTLFVWILASGEGVARI